LEKSDQSSELELISQLHKIMHRPYVGVEEKLKEIVQILPAGFKKSGRVCARISLQDEDFLTDNFKETNFSLQDVIIANGEVVGEIQVYSLNNSTEYNTINFTDEDWRLLTAISSEVGMLVEQMRRNEETKKNEEQERMLTESIPDAVFQVGDQSRHLYLDRNDVMASVGIAQDTSVDRKNGETQQNAPNERETILREAHHRIKNNLQVISSLISLQSELMTDPKALDAFKATQCRIKTLALLYELLYTSKNFVQVKFHDYVQNLVTTLQRRFNIAPKIKVNLDIQDVFLSIRDAIPCGLIINELLTNAFRHAFPNDRNGKINISFRADESRNCELVVSDNGIGMPENSDANSCSTLGLRLVHILVEQLNGRLQIENKIGTKLTVTFKSQSDRV
jgi:two-component sensor histidine kinase